MARDLTNAQIRATMRPHLSRLTSMYETRLPLSMLLNAILALWKPFFASSGASTPHDLRCGPRSCFSLDKAP